MLNPVLAALRKKRISQRKFASSLWAQYPELFKSLNRDTRSLEARLTLLGKGKRLDWWENNPGALEVVAHELGIELGQLSVERKFEQHIFSFTDFPALPALDLRREDRYHIGKPELISEKESRSRQWLNLEHWFFGEGASRSPQVLDWLQIPDCTEFSLVAAHLSAASRHVVLVLPAADMLFDQHIEAMRHRSPLIVAIDEQVNAGQLQALRDRAENAPLLIISRHALPMHYGGASEAGAEQAAIGINMWTWTLHANWRDRVIAWAENRLKTYGLTSATGATALGAWLDAFDPGQRWLPHSADVLQLCRIAQEEPTSTFDEMKNDQALYALFSRVFQIKLSHLRAMESVIRKRWLDWNETWDGELTEAGWKAAGITDAEFRLLARARHLASDEKGYRFANPLLARMLLRRFLGKEIRTASPDTWWPACFDGPRRLLLDATLEAMSMSGLVQASRLQKKRSEKDGWSIGSVEALFVAIGKHLLVETTLPTEMKVIGDIVLSQLAKEPDTTRPWSRPYQTIDQQFEWISSVWMWSLFTETPKDAVISWLVPGWNRERIPEQFPDWLHPRASYFRETMPIPRRESLAYFCDAAYQWSEILKVPPEGDVPPLLAPALMWRAARGAWRIRTSWWGKILSDGWCEDMLLRLFTREGSADDRYAAGALWTSLIEWLIESGRSTASAHVIGKNLQLPSCRADSPRYSPAFHWVARHLAAEDVLGLLTEEKIRYLHHHPQWLLTEHKLLVLGSLARHLPLELPPYMRANFFSAYLPDAVEGLVDFLHDSDLGVEAAVAVWNWAPSRALEMLQESNRKGFEARRQLVITCPPEQLGGVLLAVQGTPELLPLTSREKWVRYHLPYAGVLASLMYQLL